MDALKIALETMIVGILGLPWVLLLVDLFCPERERLIKTVLERLADKATATLASAALFALAYLLGASTARVADDFFNDDDLNIGVSEDNIRTAVYCEQNDDDRWLLQNGAALIDKDGAGTDSKTLCADRNTWDNKVRQTSAVQEASLLLTSTGNTDRIRYLHQQLVVLRGVAFDGMIVTLLCLFGLCAKHHPWGRLSLIAVSLVMLAWTGYAIVRHLRQNSQHLPAAPPLMEVALILLALAGLFLAWKQVPQRPYECAFMFSAVLTGLAISGWWYSEILYDHTVIYFFYAHAHKVSTLSP